MARPQIADGGTTSNMKDSCENINKSRIADKGWSSSLEIGQGVKIPRRKK
jgi:hypothetical protein